MEYHHSATPEEILRQWSLTLKLTLKLDYQKKESVILQEKDQAVISVTQSSISASLVIVQTAYDFWCDWHNMKHTALHVKYSNQERSLQFQLDSRHYCQVTGNSTTRKQ